MANNYPVIVVGAGPVGLLTALKLARQQIKVAVLDQSPSTNDSPRAILYGLPAVKVLHQAGVADELRAAGYTPTRVSWRKLGGEIMARLDITYPEKVQDRTLVLPVGELTSILYQSVLKEPTATVLFNHKITSIKQSNDKAVLNVTVGEAGNTVDNDRQAIFEADYVVACDGASSIIRKSLFQNEFPGMTWEKPLIATNLRFHFDLNSLDYDDANFIHHPEHGHLLARIDKTDLWRVAYVDEPNLSPEEYRARLPEKMKIMLPGNPDPDQYTVVAMNPYRVHQRLAPSFRVGRFLLAGDAAHLNSPFGGLGLTTGIVDAGAVSDCVGAVLSGKADETILDKYNEIRRDLFINESDKWSRINYLRVTDPDPETLLERDRFLQTMNAVKGDPAMIEKLKEIEMAIYHDFTAYYKQASE
ncbi:hypothetical protein PV10_06315 [Exophiala mesophila]|uniref:FAD-binding domain-containing protein n=1 Tax=Exophiala mesophila TaxID=212818 RepID=A0A0D1ZY46_EXOME|nr:uncharacterized protein PV10_06315 [Exophiala mesophila]KIV91818.1 hypothetical protein PV10_06315 [Exophiala mesophila]